MFLKLCQWMFSSNQWLQPMLLSGSRLTTIEANTNPGINKSPCEIHLSIIKTTVTNKLSFSENPIKSRSRIMGNYFVFDFLQISKNTLHLYWLFCFLKKLVSPFFKKIGQELYKILKSSIFTDERLIFTCLENCQNLYLIILQVKINVVPIHVKSCKVAERWLFKRFILSLSQLLYQ